MMKFTEKGEGQLGVLPAGVLEAELEEEVQLASVTTSGSNAPRQK